MKRFIGAAVALAAAGFAAPSFAESPAVTGYVNLGYSYVDTADSAKLSALGGRVGARIGRYLGAEGEAGFGINSDTVSGVDVKLTSTYAGYGVAFLPLMPNADLFARVGYGHSNVRGTFGGVSVTSGEDSVNYGAGAQYFFTANDGVRAEYTRFDFRNNGGSANVYGVSYVRRFR